MIIKLTDAFSLDALKHPTIASLTTWFMIEIYRGQVHRSLGRVTRQAVYRLSWPRRPCFANLHVWPHNTSTVFEAHFPRPPITSKSWSRKAIEAAAHLFFRRPPSSSIKVHWPLVGLQISYDFSSTFQHEPHIILALEKWGHIFLCPWHFIFSTISNKMGETLKQNFPLFTKIKMEIFLRFPPEAPFYQKLL